MDMGMEEARYQYVNEDGTRAEPPPDTVLAQGDKSGSGSNSGGPFWISIMQLKQDTYFKAVVLSVWDNVVGPRVKQVWLGQEDHLDGRFYQRLLPFIAKCTLSGELSRDISPENEAEMKFYVLAELECVMVSFVFGSHIGTIAAPGAAVDIFSLSLVLPLRQMPTYLELHALCADRMGALIRKLQVMLRTEGGIAQCLLPFTAALKPFLTSIADIGVASLARPIDLAETVFAPPSPPASLPGPSHMAIRQQQQQHPQQQEQQEQEQQEQQEQQQQQEAMLNNSGVPTVPYEHIGSGSGSAWDVGFLRAAITSHLQTGGVTIVFGSDAERTQRLISTLALFLSPGERRRSRAARAGVSSYAPDLVLQGILAIEGEDSFDAEVLMQSAHASTVIDLISNSVQQTQRENVYHVLQKAHEEDRLQAMASRAEEGGGGGGGGGESSVGARGAANPRLLHTVRSSAALVKDLLSQVLHSPRPALSKPLIEQFKRLITRRALIMVEYIDALAASPDNPLDAEQLTRLKKVRTCVCVSLQ